MSDKLNLDELKKFENAGYENKGNESFDLETILRDFGDKKDEPEVAECPSTDIDDVEVVKPQGLSITGVFEAIHSEKVHGSDTHTEKVRDFDFENTEENDGTYESADDKISEENSSDNTSNEISASIENVRYFDTATFNSIKEQAHEKIKSPIASFAKGDGEEEDVEGEEIPAFEPTEEIDDYENEEEKEDVAAELRRIRSSASLKTILTFITACLSGALFTALCTGFTVPGIDIEYDISVYIPIMLALSVAATAVNAASIWNGFAGIFKLKCSSESFLAVIFIFSFVLDICYIVLKTPASECIVFDLLYVIMLFFSINSKRIIADNIYKNFAIVSAEGTKMVMDNRQNDELINDIIVDTGCSNDIAYAARSEFVSDFVRRSFLDFDLCSKYSAPGIFLLFGAVLTAAVNYAVIGSFTTCLKFAAGALCAVSPLIQGMNFAVSVYTNSKKTRRNGGSIAGINSCLELDDVQTVVIDDSDIFSVSLNGIRFYGDATADKVILYLNSLYRVAGGPLKPLFSDMLSEDIKTLPRIDDIYYHDKMGYSSLIDSKVFLAGNKQLMEHFGIEFDDRDFEIIYQQKSKHVLFAAYDGRLAGVFLLSYSLSANIKRAFETYERDQVCVVIAEHDQNVNTDTLFYHYRTDDKLLFKILNFGSAQRCVQKFRPVEKAPSLIASRTGICGLAFALHGCKSVKFAFGAGRIIKAISSVIAFALVTFLAFFSGMTSYFPIQILVYQLLWALPAMFVSLFSK